MKTFIQELGYYTSNTKIITWSYTIYQIINSEGDSLVVKSVFDGMNTFQKEIEKISEVQHVPSIHMDYKYSFVKQLPDISTLRFNAHNDGTYFIENKRGSVLQIF